MGKKVLGWLLIPYIMLGILVSKKLNKKSLGIIVGILSFILYLGIISSLENNTGNSPTSTNTNVSVSVDKSKPTPTTKSISKPVPKPSKPPKLTKEQIAKKKKETEQKEKQLKKAQADKEFNKWVESQFSVWDGSHKELVKLIKENMNDPDSFEHVETRYSINKNKDGILVIMKYRGNNAFGGKVLNYVTAKADYKTNAFTIVSNE